MRAEYLCARLLNTVFHKGDDWQTMPKVDELGDVPPETLLSEEKWCKFLVDADNPSKQDYINRLTASDRGIMRRLQGFPKTRFRDCRIRASLKTSVFRGSHYSICLFPHHLPFLSKF
jgi:hypothetical protein